MIDFKLGLMAFATEDHDRLIRFGRFTFDLATNRLFENGKLLPIQDQPATLLAILLERPRELVTREELQARLWPDKQFLEFDAALNTTVKKLRQVLKDDASAPQFIQTVPKKGYRFIGESFSETRITEFASDVRKLKVVRISQESTAADVGFEPVEANQANQETLPSERRRVVVTPITFWARHWLAISVTGIAFSLISATLLVFFRPRPLPELPETQLTSNSTEDVIVDSALSPDGKYLAYANWRHVMILNLAERVTYTLPNLDRLRVFHLAWMRDSTRLLVTGYAGPGATAALWRVSILGNGEPQKIADNVSDARESPDGKYFAFFNADSSELSIMSPGERERISLYRSKQMFSISWSPDSRRIWFLRDLGDTWQSLESVSLEAGHPAGPVRKLHEAGSILLLPDSRLVYSQPDGIFEQKTDSRSGRALGDPIRRIKCTASIRLSATSDGTKVGYLKGASESDVYVGDLSEGNTRLSNTHRLTLDDAGDYVHGWTRDSRNVLFESDRSGQWTSYSQPFDGPDPTRLVASEADAVKAISTPDGVWILYLSLPPKRDQSDRVKGSSLMRMRVSGGAPVEVVALERAASFHCPAAQSKLCVMEERFGGNVLYSYLDPIHGKQGPFRPMETIPSEIDWDLSPDGSTIAVVPRTGNDSRIWLFKGSEPKREITVTNAEQLRSVNWWPDGKGFFMSSSGDGNPLLVTVPLSGRASVLSREIISVPSWGVPSPDGKRLAFVCYPNSYKAWMVDRF